MAKSASSNKKGKGGMRGKNIGGQMRALYAKGLLKASPKKAGAGAAPSAARPGKSERDTTRASRIKAGREIAVKNAPASNALRIATRGGNYIEEKNIKNVTSLLKGRVPGPQIKAAVQAGRGTSAGTGASARPLKAAARAADVAALAKARTSVSAPKAKTPAAPKAKTPAQQARAAYAAETKAMRDALKAMPGRAHDPQFKMLGGISSMELEKSAMRTAIRARKFKG